MSKKKKHIAASSRAKGGIDLSALMDVADMEEWMEDMEDIEDMVDANGIHPFIQMTDTMITAAVKLTELVVSVEKEAASTALRKEQVFATYKEAVHHVMEGMVAGFDSCLES